eukprot:330625-Pyramimonas_sp.AAC.1
MDLEKMTKRLKAGKYMCKSEFQRDVDLIVSNCRYFNDPSSTYVRKVNALNNKATAFLKNVTITDNLRERQHNMQVRLGNPAHVIHQLSAPSRIHFTLSQTDLQPSARMIDTLIPAASVQNAL